MSNDPLTEHLKMQSLLSYRCCHLFNDQGKAKVLLRQKRTIKDAAGIKRDFLHIEWGDLESSFLGDNKKRFTDAWDTFISWKGANA